MSAVLFTLMISGHGTLAATSSYARSLCAGMLGAILMQTPARATVIQWGCDANDGPHWVKLRGSYELPANDTAGAYRNIGLTFRGGGPGVDLSALHPHIHMDRVLSLSSSGRVFTLIGGSKDGTSLDVNHVEGSDNRDYIYVAFPAASNSPAYQHSFNNGICRFW